MGSVEIIEVLPLLELLAEQTRVVDHHAVELPVELFVVDTVGSFHLAIQPGSCRLDVDVADPSVQQVPVE